MKGEYISRVEDQPTERARSLFLAVNTSKIPDSPHPKKPASRIDIFEKVIRLDKSLESF